MATENQSGTEVTLTVETPPESPPVLEGEILSPEGGDENEPGEGVSDAVAIAAIETEGETRIEEIRSETAVELAEIAAAERAAEREQERTWQEEMADLRENIRELTERIASLSSAQASTPQPSEIPGPELEPEAPTDLTPQSTLDEISSTATEALLESADESPALEILPPEAPARRRRRLI